MHTSLYLSLVTALFLSMGCASTRFAEVYEFDSEPVEAMGVEYFDLAISAQGKGDDVTLAVEAAHAENSLNTKTDKAILRVLKKPHSIQTMTVGFERKNDTIFYKKGRHILGRLGKVSPAGLVMLSQGTVNVRMVSVDEKPTLILDEPVISILSQKSARAHEVSEIQLASKDRLVVKTESGESKSISFLQSILVRPEFEKSGLLSPYKAVLETSGRFLYAKISGGQDKVAIAHITDGNRVKLLSAFKPTFVALGKHDYLWVSPR